MTLAWHFLSADGRLRDGRKAPRDGAGVADLAALALCADHPLTTTSPEGSST